MKPVVAFAALAAVIAALAGLWAFFSSPADSPRMEGELSGALFAALGDRQGRHSMDAVYDRFIAPDMPIEERAGLLAANGFACTLDPEGSGDGSRQIRCVRPAEGTQGCEGFTYYAHHGPDGRFREAGGDSYWVAPANRDGGRCESNIEVVEEMEAAIRGIGGE